ncbi:ATP-binding protein (plasmid) [Rhizobium leguminosarum]|uniref:ATP-binding protein n=1 Tax=Rhizobium TaxID=379 RepID=UPI00102F4C47|nr:MULTISPECIES: ATP-binding protein [Rhizobium]TAV45455.1 ATP-binding protein [Rhizobium leguminosarum]TAV46012.1 ATP-binding protein [Rhizobium leguminosarum]TAV63867.1 ATP-binding protein [Rhizobium leguminosarum]TAX05508.1 ATP-binding protein [Rhizobium leguminosarum]TAX87622.1 ATP-binding protein [Rhizobium leguminosarum]
MANVLAELDSQTAFDRVLAEQIRMRQHYVKTKVNPVLRDRLNQLVRNARACLNGGGMKQRALVIIGESGSGKTTSVNHHIAQIPEMQPYVNEEGRLIDPVLRMDTPGTNTTKSFAIAMLAGIGIPASQRASEFELYAVLKHQLKEQGKLFVLADESQHLVRAAQIKTVEKVQDVLKNLMQIEGWPLHMIFIGTPALAKFLQGDKQLANRCRVLMLPQLDPAKDSDFLERTLKEIVVDVGGLNMGWKESEELPQRLIRASFSCTGTAIQYIQEACFRAMDEGKTVVKIKHFAKVYEANTGCNKQDNLFSVVAWEKIKPENALQEFMKTVEESE